jgi:TolA-binding protein
MTIGTIPGMDNGLFLLLVVLCLVILSVSMLRRSRQRSATGRELSREQLARLRDQRDVRASMDELLIQLEDVSRRINAQVDTRFLKLETVIREADQRIARLEQLTGSKSRRPADSTPARNLSSPLTTPTGTEKPQPESPDAVLRSDSANQSPAPAESREQRRQHVYDLADTGTTPITIADMLRMPLGEVELILSLRKFK